MDRRGSEFLYKWDHPSPNRISFRCSQISSPEILLSDHLITFSWQESSSGSSSSIPPNRGKEESRAQQSHLDHHLTPVELSTASCQLPYAMTDDTSSNQNPKERTDTNPPKRKSLSPGLWLLKHVSPQTRRATRSSSFAELLSPFPFPDSIDSDYNHHSSCLEVKELSCSLLCSGFSLYFFHR